MIIFSLCLAPHFPSFVKVAWSLYTFSIFIISVTEQIFPIAFAYCILPTNFPISSISVGILVVAAIETHLCTSWMHFCSFSIYFYCASLALSSYSTLFAFTHWDFPSHQICIPWIKKKMPQVRHIACLIVFILWKVKQMPLAQMNWNKQSKQNKMKK